MAKSVACCGRRSVEDRATLPHKLGVLERDMMLRALKTVVCDETEDLIMASALLQLFESSELLTIS